MINLISYSFGPGYGEYYAVYSAKSSMLTNWCLPFALHSLILFSKIRLDFSILLVNLWTYFKNFCIQDVQPVDSHLSPDPSKTYWNTMEKAIKILYPKISKSSDWAFWSTILNWIKILESIYSNTIFKSEYKIEISFLKLCRILNTKTLSSYDELITHYRKSRVPGNMKKVIACCCYSFFLFVLILNGQ